MCTEKTAHMAHHGSLGPEEGDGDGSNSPHRDKTVAFDEMESMHIHKVPSVIKPQTLLLTKAISRKQWRDSSRG